MEHSQNPWPHGIGRFDQRLKLLQRLGNGQLRYAGDTFLQIPIPVHNDGAAYGKISVLSEQEARELTDSFPRGERFRIHHNPADPRQVLILSFSIWWLTPLFALAIVSFCAVLATGKRRRSGSIIPDASETNQRFPSETSHAKGSVMTAKMQTGTQNQGSLYDADIIVWAEQQARLLRAGRLSELDIEHIAEEIEDVGKSEQRELASRMAVLLAHLSKWQYQRRGTSWRRTIREQRNGIARRLRRTPSLKYSLRDADWWADAWGDAVSAAIQEAALEDLPESSPWEPEQVLDPQWLPSLAP